MRELTDEFALAIGAEAATLAHAWKVTRRDGAVFGFTEHDAPFAFGGVGFAPRSGFSAGARESGDGLAAATASALGGFDAAAMTAEDLEAGLWDGAEIETWLVDWTAPGRRLLLARGRLGEVRREGARYHAEVREAQAELSAPIGRIYSRNCDAELGDVRCGVALAPLSHTGQIAARQGDRVVTLAAAIDVADGHFAYGTIRTGAFTAEIAAHAGVRIVTATPMPAAFGPGEAVVLTPGCDKRFDTCRNTFANAANFRGFPHMPGPDAAIGGVRG
jgi:uncharacterized phage protein (TIGR02218 family)